MKLFFQQIHQEAIEADIPSCITLDQLRELLVSQYSFPDKHMKFIVKGQILTNSSNFAEIEENSRIIVYIKKDPIVQKKEEEKGQNNSNSTTNISNTPQTKDENLSDLPTSAEPPQDHTQKESQINSSSNISSSLPFNLVSQNPENVTIAPSSSESYVKSNTTSSNNNNNLLVNDNINNNNDNNNNNVRTGKPTKNVGNTNSQMKNTNTPRNNISYSLMSNPSHSLQQQILRNLPYRRFFTTAALENSIATEIPLNEEQIERVIGECLKKIRLEQLYNEKYEFYGQLNETRRMADMIDHNPGLRLVLKQFFNQNYTVACQNQEVRIKNAFALAGFVTTAPTTLKDEDDATLEMMPTIHQEAVKRLMTIGKTKAETIKAFLEANYDENMAEEILRNDNKPS